MASTFDPYYKWLGIRPEEQPANHYRLLAVALFESDLDVIASAADQRMAHVRSFQSGVHSALSQKVLNEIAAARVCLLNPEKKAAYDEALRRTTAAPASVPEPASAAEAESPLDFSLASSQATTAHISPPVKRRKVEPWQVSAIAVAAVLIVGAAAILMTRGGAEPIAPSTAKATTSPRHETAIVPASRTVASKSSEDNRTAKLPHQPTESQAAKSDVAQQPAIHDPPVAAAKTSQDVVTAAASGVPAGAWISKDAAYAASSALAQHIPLASLLTDEGPRYSSDQFAFEANDDKTPPFIGIHLPQTRTLSGFYIQNRTGEFQERAAGLTVWVSLDHKDWQKVWTADKVEQVWTVNLSKPVQARYVKIGLLAPGILHLRTVKLFGQKDAPEVASALNTATSVSEQTDTPPVAADPRPAVADTDTRHPVPDADSQARGMKLIKEVYGEEYAAAKSLDQKKALAKKLLEKADESGEDATAQYLLLKLARDVAVQGVDAQTALGAIDKMANLFQVDGLEMKVTALSSISGKVRLAPEHRAIARQANELIDVAVKSDRFDLTSDLGDLAAAEADAAHDLELVKEMKARTVAVRELAAAYEDTKKAMTTLKENPKSPEANLIAGKYYCFSKRDWAKGLPMLASGNASAVRELAAKDMESPAATEEQVKLGDGWWEFAESEEGVAREAIQERAALWYKRAMPQLAGLAKDKVEKRLQDISSNRATLGPGGASPTKQAAAMVGTFLVSRTQRKIKQRQMACWEFRQDGSVWEKERQAAQWNATDNQVRVIFSDKALGEAILRPKGRDLYIGTQVRANDETWACELRKVFVVSVWEYHWGDRSRTIKLWSSGGIDVPDSQNPWERKGSTIIFNFAPTGGGVDTCTLAPDGTSFKGSNQFGLPIWGKLISEK